MSTPSLPLAGIRILDFTRVLAGPLSTALLADLGAEVLKVEPPQGDDYRHIGPLKNGESALFTVMNRNKKSLLLDLKHADAPALVQALAREAHVVVENFRPGVAERLGIGATQLMEANPKLVYVSVSGFGQTGPYAHRPAYDIIVQAMSGLMEIAAIAALRVTVAAEEPAVRIKPVNITINFMRGGREARTYALGEVTRIGRRVANVEAKAWQDDPAKPIATIFMNFLLSSPKPA